ncbi:uncharacterized protein A4U43_C08F27390 [Asparagus officinalis]|nr:uncharacterized protein A4U43_C08F27390 [Asparagus officinalis]
MLLTQDEGVKSFITSLTSQLSETNFMSSHWDSDDEYEIFFQRMNPPRVVIDNESCANATIVRNDGCRFREWFDNPVYSVETQLFPLMREEQEFKLKKQEHEACYCLDEPLSVELGPGILGNVFDGIQRPLKTIAIRSGDVYIPRGVSVPALDKDALWEFEPKKLAVGDLLTGGDLYATVFENTLMQHHVALPPGSMGKISHIAPAGQYSLQDTVLELEFQGINKNFTMLQTWHVRTPRPVATKLAADTPLLTGQMF